MPLREPNPDFVKLAKRLREHAGRIETSRRNISRPICSLPRECWMG
jgi:hypothetical protein